MNKTIFILRHIPLAFSVFMIVMSASLKLAGSAQLVEHYTQLQLLAYMKTLGLMELIFVALFLHPQTLKIGFLFLTAYFGGAIATELSHGNTIVFPSLILALVWVAAGLRKRSFFAEELKQKRPLQYSRSTFDFD